MSRFFLAGAIGLSLSGGIASATETVTYTYDARGRIMQAAHTGTVNNGIVTTYAHDTADNRKQVTTTGASH